VVLEYVTDQFVQVSGEIATQSQSDSEPMPDQSPAKDCVREMQKRLIVEPIAEQLRIQFGNPQALSCS